MQAGAHQHGAHPRGPWICTRQHYNKLWAARVQLAWQMASLQAAVPITARSMAMADMRRDCAFGVGLFQQVVRSVVACDASDGGAAPGWMTVLDTLDGLTDDEKAQAEVLIVKMPINDRDAFVAGTPARARARIKAALASSAAATLPVAGQQDERSPVVYLKHFMATTTTGGADYQKQPPRSAIKSSHAEIPEQVVCWGMFEEDCMAWFTNDFNPDAYVPVTTTCTASLPVWDEAGVRSFLDGGVFALANVVLRSGVLGASLEVAKPLGLAGGCDRAICAAGSRGGDILLPIEVKHAGVLLETEELHMYEPPPPNPEARTALQRVVEQGYGHMTKNGFTYAVLCDDQRFWFAKREANREGERLCLSRAIKCSQTSPTVVIALCYIAHLARMQDDRQQMGVGPKRSAPQAPQSRRSILQLTAAAWTKLRNFFMGVRPGTYSATDVALGGLIGRGSVGSVYRGSLHGQPVAVKIAHQAPHPAPEEYSAAEAVQHLEHEVAAYGRLAAVQGKYVPRLMAYGTLMSDAGEPFPFMATSLIGDGLPLCEAAAKLQPWQLAAVAREAVAAVAAIHQLGVAHNDVRSPNVLLAADGSVRLVDLSEAVLQPQLQHYEGDMAGMHSVLTEMAQQCLHVNREHAAGVVQQWLGGEDAC